MLNFYNLFYLNYFVLELNTISKVLDFLVFSLILLVTIGSFIHFSGGIKKGLKDLGNAALLGGAAKLGSDSVDYIKDELKKIVSDSKTGNEDTKVSSEDKNKGSNDSSGSSNNSNTSNNNK